MAKNNDCYFEGNIGKDPEIKGKVTKFSLAVWRGKEKPTLWVPIISFDDVPFGKGDKVKVVGRLDMNEYQGKQYWQVIADSINLKEDTRKDKDFPTEEEDVPL